MRKKDAVEEPRPRFVLIDAYGGSSLHSTIEDVKDQIIDDELDVEEIQVFSLDRELTVRSRELTIE